MNDIKQIKLMCKWCGAPTVERGYCNNKHMKKAAELSYLTKAQVRDIMSAQPEKRFSNGKAASVKKGETIL